MSVRTGFLPRLGLWLASSLIPTAYLEGVRWIAGGAFVWSGLVIRWIFVLAVLNLARLALAHHRTRTEAVRPVVAAGMAMGSTGLAGIYILSGATWAAWGLLVLVPALLLVLERYLAVGQRLLPRWVWRGFLAAAVGGLPTALSQIESHFADEEFFVGLEAAVLAIFWLLLLMGLGLLSQAAPDRAGTRGRRARRPVAILLLLLLFAGCASTIRAYQRSFYPPGAPSFPGITPEHPFLCGEVTPDPQTYDGEEVFLRLLARVQDNPDKGPPEYGMLALGTGEQRWADAFRESLLQETRETRFTGPAHSVKSVQYEAALRAYYYPRVRDRFPELFAGTEIAEIQHWFADINRRALTVEWVDWMYALAFAKWPEGPYENQENGAGLIALLELEGLADPELSPKNQDYLARNQRGWAARFRVTDDALIYQPEWIHNAYFQSLYTGTRSLGNLRLSFEWLLAQSLPDGSPLRYNHPVGPSLAGVFYAGAHWLNDSHYLWLAGRAVEALERAGQALSAQPGAEEPLRLTGVAASTGSCLLYGDSGLPNQTGPLAPDKIVFRDGWLPDSAYVLFNLRFSGWHRYKATNTVTLVYQDGPLAGDAQEGEAFAWLPVGRSLFRDKRIPRENLSGLVVERTGISAVLYTLTGVGGAWAQDPPYYAEVAAFETGEALDWSHTQITDWHGWQHDRWIYFYHDGGPIVLIDAVKGPSDKEAALLWHFSGGERTEQGRFMLRGGEQPVEAVLVPVDAGAQLKVTEGGSDGTLGLRVEYGLPDQGELHMVTAYLQGEWVGAEVMERAGEVWIEGNKDNLRVSLSVEP